LAQAVQLSVRLVDYPTHGLETLDLAASKCYRSTVNPDWPEGTLAGKCADSGHTSILEHGMLVWEVEGVSRALLGQLTRHRHASFSVESQRYVCYAGEKVAGFDYVIPPSIAADEDAQDDYHFLMYCIQEQYAKFVSQHNIPSEDARFILPMGTATRLIVSMNLRAFIEFAQKRLCKRAQWEIRRMTQLMVKSLKAIYPDPTLGSDYLHPMLAKQLQPPCKAFMPELPTCREAKSCGLCPTVAQRAAVADAAALADTTALCNRAKGGA